MKTYDLPESKYVLVNSQELEAFVAEPTLTQPKVVNRSGFDRLLDFLLNTFGQTSEPKIRRKRDRDGNEYFRVYDPSTGMSSTFTSEQEVRIWLDRRYYD
jgi:hypothetical protein